MMEKETEEKVRAFASAYTKIYIYFSIKTYFFILHFHFSKHPQKIIYLTLYFIKISILF